MNCRVGSSLPTALDCQLHVRQKISLKAKDATESFKRFEPNALSDNPCMPEPPGPTWSLLRLVPANVGSAEIQPQEVPWFQQRHNDLIFAWLHQGKKWHKHSAACVKWRCEICPFMLASVKQSVYTTQVSQLLEPIGLPASASSRKTIAHMRSRPVPWSNTSFSDIGVEKCICHLLFMFIHCAFEPSIKTCKRIGWTCKSRKKMNTNSGAPNINFGNIIWEKTSRTPHIMMLDLLAPTIESTCPA